MKKKSTKKKVWINHKAKTYKDKKVVYQTHHITYVPEKTVRVRRSEHYYITLLSRFNSLTPGAKKAIRHICRTKPDFEEKYGS